MKKGIILKEEVGFTPASTNKNTGGSKSNVNKSKESNKENSKKNNK